MQNALIFSPSFDGHRQVHVFVMVQVLEELGFNIFIAGNTQEKISNSFYIDKLKNKPAIRILDTNNYSDGGLKITLSEFVELQNKCEANLTIFAEADNHISLFNSQIFKKKSRLRGKVIGTFLRPFYYYRKTPFLDKLRFIKHFFSRWKKDEKLFFTFILKRFSLLDVSLSIDENFADHHPKFTWIPDVFQQYAEIIIKKNESPAQGEWIEKLKAFKEKNKDRFPFLYFGTAQYRRGYDVLLKLAEETGGCFIHCGLRDPDAKFSYNTDEIKSKLKNEGRLFETNEYIEDPVCIEYFFRSVSHLILPYTRNFFGSSGVMSQALEYGIPILAPDSGIMGHRIKKHRLGQTYSTSKKDSLKLAFNDFKNMSPNEFRKDIRSYMKTQSTEYLRSTLLNSFGHPSKKLTNPTMQEA